LVSNDSVVVEFLRLQVPEENRLAWVNAEKQSWEPWLLSQKGFLGRKLFWDPNTEQAFLLISWASSHDWKSIPQFEIDLVQERFEELARNETGMSKGNPFPLTDEGELIPQ